jgi:hypothetical protein
MKNILVLLQGLICHLYIAVRNTENQMGCRTATDDYLLSASVLHLCDLERVYQRVTFSMPFSLVDIQNRWQCVLYDALISKERSSC